MKTLILKVLIPLGSVSLMAACTLMPDLGNILPDKQSEYKKSESLPDLEIPPDLTAGALSGSMDIPGEQTTSLSEYAGARQPQTPATATQTDGGEEQRLSLTGTKEDIWPGLREFFTAKDYPVEVDDAELGVLETGWSAPIEQAGLTGRDRYRVFYEQGDTEELSVLYVSQQRQTRLESDDDWVDQDKDPETELALATELRRFFKADERPEKPVAAAAPVITATTETAAAVSGEAPRLLNAGEDKMYLSIPEGFAAAWQNTELALQDSDWQIIEKDQENRVFRLGYQEPEGGAAEEKKGLLSTLAFWRRNKSEPVMLQLRFTPTGDGARTDLAALDENNEWRTTPETSRLLELIRDRYPAAASE